MRRFRGVILAAFMTFALGVMVASAAAQGLPTASPSSKESTTDGISVSSPKFELTNKNKIECTTASAWTATETGAPAASGVFHFTFRGCIGEVSGIKMKCTGLGDATEGELLILGKYQTVYDTGGTELGTAILFEINSEHLACGGIFLQVYAGNLLCLVKEPYVTRTLHQMVCEQKEGIQKETYLNDAGETIKPKLLVTEGESNKPEGALEATYLVLHLNAAKENISTVFKMN